MSAAMPMLDPTYQDSAVLRWASGRLSMYGIKVVPVDGLTDAPIGAHRATKTLYLAPGHTVDTAYHLLCRGALFLAGGINWAPEFGGAYAGNVIPMQRRG